MDFIQQHPFAQLVCATDTFPVINHIPFLFDTEQNCLWGHLAKNNQDIRHLSNSPVTVVFSGPHGYISPDWYENPGVPTWNYQAVHIRGISQVDTAESTVKKVVDGLSTQHQSRLDATWSDDYNPSLLSAIVAIRIDIQPMQCQFKLSQDRSAKDRQQVIKALQDNNQIELAEAIIKTFDS